MPSFFPAQTSMLIWQQMELTHFQFVCVCVNSHVSFFSVAIYQKAIVQSAQHSLLSFLQEDINDNNDNENLQSTNSVKKCTKRCTVKLRE